MSRFTHEDLLKLPFLGDDLKTKAKEYANRHAVALGVDVDWDEQALNLAIQSWKHAMVDWNLRAVRETNPFADRNGRFKGLSHIKYMAVLLWALTQTDLPPIRAAEAPGEIPQDLKELLLAYPNEYFCFHSIYLSFHDLQLQRGIKSRFEGAPPAHYRYLRAIVHYLARPQFDGSKKVHYEDLYLILKTVDLVGWVTNYGPNGSGTDVVVRPA